MEGFPLLFHQIPEISAGLPLAWMVATILPLASLPASLAVDPRRLQQQQQRWSRVGRFPILFQPTGQPILFPLQ